MSDPFRDELEAAHRRIEMLEKEHKLSIERLERENRRLNARLVEVAPSRTKTGRVFLALAVTTMGFSIAAGMIFARAVRPQPTTPAVQIIQGEPAIELGEAPTAASDFDRAAIAAALDAVKIDDCIDASHRPGGGHVKLVVLASGLVAQATVDRGDYASTSEGRCIEQRFRAAHTPTWTGSARTIGKAFTIR
jgi:hypothetical protein